MSGKLQLTTDMTELESALNSFSVAGREHRSKQSLTRMGRDGVGDEVCVCVCVCVLA